MHKITPNLEEIEKVRLSAPQGAITMVNLMKFNGDEGKEIFSQYLQLSNNIVLAENINVKIIYVGEAGSDFSGGEDWDMVGLAEYENFDEFVKLMTHPDYINKATPLRDKALARTLLMYSTPLNLS